MATYGRARERTIAALTNHEPFARSGFAMSAIEGKDTRYTGRLPAEYVSQYDTADVIYTVYSYVTPIAWVNSDGYVTVPNVHYSPTTSAHQSLARAYLSGRLVSS